MKKLLFVSTIFSFLGMAAFAQQPKEIKINNFHKTAPTAIKSESKPELKKAIKKIKSSSTPIKLLK